MINIGSADRTIRFVIGLLLIVLPLIPPTASWFAPLGNWTWAVLAVGAVLALTAAVSFCPAYALLGLNSCPRRQ